MPVDVEHARTLARGATASVVKAKVRKWSAKKNPAAEAKCHKRHCTRASSSDSRSDGQFAGTTATASKGACADGQFAGTTATASKGACAEVNKPDVELQ